MKSFYAYQQCLLGFDSVKCKHLFIKSRRFAVGLHRAHIKCDFSMMPLFYDDEINETKRVETFQSLFLWKLIVCNLPNNNFLLPCQHVQDTFLLSRKFSLKWADGRIRSTQSLCDDFSLKIAFLFESEVFCR